MIGGRARGVCVRALVGNGALFAPDCDDREDWPPPVPERTAESFLMATGASLLCPATRGQQRL